MSDDDEQGIFYHDAREGLLLASAADNESIFIFCPYIARVNARRTSSAFFFAVVVSIL